MTTSIIWLDNDFSNSKHWNNLPKIKMYLPKAQIDEFCFLVRTDLEKFRLTSLGHQWILCSEWVPSEWVQKLIKHHNKPHDSSPSGKVLWRKQLSVCKKQSIKTLNFKLLLLAIISLLSIILLFQMKNHLIWIKRELCTDQALCICKNRPNKLVDLREQGMILHSRKHCYGHVLARIDIFKTP